MQNISISVLFAFKQRKRRISLRVSDDYDDIDEAEDSKSVYRGNILLWLWYGVLCCHNE